MAKNRRRRGRRYRRDNSKEQAPLRSRMGKRQPAAAGSRLRFAKMHGLGNDFMVIDSVTQEWRITPSQVQRWSDRRTGVGFDQALIVEPPTAPEVDFDYRIFNADGSPAEQCGNGVRCIVRFAHHRQLTFKPRLHLATGGRRVCATLVGEEVAVEFQPPSTDFDAVPFVPATGGEALAAQQARQVQTSGGMMELTPVSLGNPHGVIFVEDVGAAPVSLIGGELSRHACFPEGANIGFCQVIDPGQVRLRVHERGVGETRACGTGACAAVVAGRLHGRLGPSVRVSLPGGEVQVQWQGPGAPVTMTGAAALAYEGELEA